MMNDREMATYLGLGFSEFQQLQDNVGSYVIEGYRLLDEVSPNLEQLPTRLNRPPQATEDSDARLEALSVAAFAALEASTQANEEFRRQRAEGAQRARQRRQRDPRDPLCRMPGARDCVAIGLQLAAKIERLGFERELKTYNRGRAWAEETGYVAPDKST